MSRRRIDPQRFRRCAEACEALKIVGTTMLFVERPGRLTPWMHWLLDARLIELRRVIHGPFEGWWKIALDRDGHAMLAALEIAELQEARADDELLKEEST